MKTKNILYILLVVFSLTSCNTKVATLVLTNDTDMQRIDEPILITREKMVSLLGSIPDNLYPILSSCDGTEIPNQADDVNNDGQWDELAFVMNFDAQEKNTIHIRFVHKDKVPTYKPRTNVRFAKIIDGGYQEIVSAERIKGMDTKITSKILQMEGPAWESDKIAFRHYLDERSGMDIFGKITDQMILDSVGINEDYHQMQPWGMDILKVGQSLGAGSIAMLIGDSLYRLGSDCACACTLITEGPVRSMLRLTYNDWRVLNRTYNITHDITIWAGSYAYENMVTIDKTYGDEQLVLGIVNIHSDSLIFSEYNNDYISISTHDNQAFDGEILGMSILMNKRDYISKGKTADEGKGITHTYYASMQLMTNNPVIYSFYAGWEKSNPDFKIKEKYLDMIQQESMRKTHPIKIFPK